jgi:hypothetical protein
MNITIQRNHKYNKCDSRNTKFSRARYMVIIIGLGALTEVATKSSVFWDAMS